MAKIPVYESRVKTTALPTPTVRPVDNNLDALGKGISAAGAAADKFADAYEKEKDKARATQGAMAANDLEREITDAFYNDSDDPKKRGFKLSNGVDAFANGRDEATRKRIHDFAKARAESIPDPDARAQVLADFDKRLVYVDRDIEQHTGAQREVAEKVELSSLEDTYVAGAVRNGPDVSEANIVSLLEKKKRLARDPAENVAYERELRGRMYDAMLRDHLGRDDVDAAEKILNEKERWLPPGIVDKTRTAIKDRKYDIAADAIASGVVTNATDDDGKPNLEKMVVPDGIVDKDLRDRTDRMLRQKRVEEDRRWDTAKGDAYNGALSAYLQNKSNGLVAAAGPGGERKRWMLKHDAPAWDRIEKRWQDDVDRWKRLKADARGDKTGTPDSETLALAKLRRDMLDNGEAYKDIPAEELLANFGKELGSQSKAAVRMLGDFQGKVAKDPAYLVKIGRVRSTAKAIVRDFDTRKKGATKMETAEVESFLNGWVDAKISDDEIPTGEQLAAEADRYVATRLGSSSMPEQPKRRPSLMKMDEPTRPEPAEAPRASDSAAFLDEMLTDGTPAEKPLGKRVRADGKTEYWFKGGRIEVAP